MLQFSSWAIFFFLKSTVLVRMCSKHFTFLQNYLCKDNEGSNYLCNYKLILKYEIYLPYNYWNQTGFSNYLSRVTGMPSKINLSQHYRRQCIPLLLFFWLCCSLGVFLFFSFFLRYCVSITLTQKSVLYWVCANVLPTHILAGKHWEKQKNTLKCFL